MWAGVLTLNVVQKLPYYHIAIRHFKRTKSASCLSHSFPKVPRKYRHRLGDALPSPVTPLTSATGLWECATTVKNFQWERMQLVFSYDLGYQADVDCACP